MPKGNDRIPPFHFQVQAISFNEGNEDDDEDTMTMMGGIQQVRVKRKKHHLKRKNRNPGDEPACEELSAKMP